MKYLLSFIALFVFLDTAHAQQYGWQVVSQPTTLASAAIEFVDSLNGWMAEIHGDARIFRTRDGGITWIAALPPANTNGVEGLSFVDTSNGWAATTDGYIFKTVDGGQTWTNQFENGRRDYYTIASLTNMKSLAGGHKGFDAPDTGFINRTTDGGATWLEQPFQWAITTIQFVDSLNGWAGGFGSAILRTRDGGNTWIEHQTPYLLYKLSFVDTLRGWGLTGQRIQRTVDGGLTWQSVLSYGGDFVFNELSFVDSLNGWAFGDTVISGSFREIIYRTTDGGNTWFAESAGLTSACGTGTAFDKYHAWAVSEDGKILKYDLTTAVTSHDEIPKSFHLGQNYPNPFNPSTMIEYSLPKRTHVRLTVSDLLGKTVRVLVNAEQQAGVHKVEFDASELSSGRYFYTLTTGEFEETKSMILIR